MDRYAPRALLFSSESSVKPALKYQTLIGNVKSYLINTVMPTKFIIHSSPSLLKIFVLTNRNFWGKLLWIY